VDDCCNTDSSVAARAGKQLHDERVYSHPVGNCHHRGAGCGKQERLRKDKTIMYIGGVTK
jgi:hypothetical protein